MPILTPVPGASIHKGSWRLPREGKRASVSAAQLTTLRTTPVRVHTSKEKARTFWAFRGTIYSTSDLQLDAGDVLALLMEADNRRRLRLEKAHALQAMRQQLDTKAKREPLSQDVKIFVWQRDLGRCSQCGSQQGLEFDHIIPLAMGGSNTARNLQLLCEVCNRRKGATLG